jgi:hypothetical protein
VRERATRHGITLDLEVDERLGEYVGDEQDQADPAQPAIQRGYNGVSVGQSCTWKADCLADFRKAKAENFRGPTKICFFAMATNAQGLPIVQGDADPKPGYFVSTTALKQPGENVRTPQAQLDSNTVPFGVIPGTWQTSGNRARGWATSASLIDARTAKQPISSSATSARVTNWAKARSPYIRRWATTHS